jgi:hypothetical protein
MNPTDIVSKTEKGRDEIATRSHGLSSRLRQLLLIIDGTMSVAAIAQRQFDGEECLVQLRELLSQGFITLEGGGEGAVEPTAPPPMAQGGTSVPETDRLELAKRYLSEFARGTLGPDANRVIERIRACTNRSELDVLAQSCCKVVTAVAGKRKADEFMAELRSALGEE